MGCRSEGDDFYATRWGPKRVPSLPSSSFLPQHRRLQSVSRPAIHFETSRVERGGMGKERGRRRSCLRGAASYDPHAHSRTCSLFGSRSHRVATRVWSSASRVIPRPLGRAGARARPRPGRVPTCCWRGGEGRGRKYGTPEKGEIVPEAGCVYQRGSHVGQGIMIIAWK